MCMLWWRQGGIHTTVIRMQDLGLVKGSPEGGRVRGSEGGPCRMCRSSPGRRCWHSKVWRFLSAWNLWNQISSLMMPVTGLIEPKAFSSGGCPGHGGP